MICESLDILYGKRILCYNKLCLEHDVALCYSSELEGGIHVDRYYRCELFIRNALGCKTNAYNGLVSAASIMAEELHRIKPLIAMAMYAQLQNINQESAERAENLLYELLQSDDRDRIITQTSHTENIPYALINQLELNVESHSRTLLCTQTTHPKSGQIVQESFQERFDQQDF